MKPYPKYKNTGIEWMGEIPDNWLVKKLKYSVSLISEKGDGNNKIALENIQSRTGEFVNSVGSDARLPS